MKDEKEPMVRVSLLAPTCRCQRRTALGFEFDVLPPVGVKVLREDHSDKPEAGGDRLQDYGATF